MWGAGPVGLWLLLVVGVEGSAKSLQSCPTLCDPIDGSPPGFPVPGILQARTLEWVAISFSNARPSLPLPGVRNLQALFTSLWFGTEPRPDSESRVLSSQHWASLGGDGSAPIQTLTHWEWPVFMEHATDFSGGSSLHQEWLSSPWHCLPIFIPAPCRWSLQVPAYLAFWIIPN